MTESPILRDLTWVVTAAAAGLLLARAVRLPPMVAYMVAGLVLGPLTGLVAVGESVERISEVGIALLLFLVGLELSLDRIRDIGRVAVLAGAGQILVTAAGGFGLATLLGFTPVAAGFIALAVTFSSTVVVVKLLEHRGELTSLHGRMAVGILLVQDVVVALALTVLAGIGGSGPAGAVAVTAGLGRAFAGTVLLAVVAFLAARWALPRLFAWLARSQEAVFVWSLSWCFLLVLLAHALHLSVELGAFAAGVALAQLPHNEDLVRRVQPLVDFFLAVFFVSLGIRLDPGAAAGSLGAAVVLSLFVLAGKPLVVMLLLPRFGVGGRTAFMTGLYLGQTSEFSFILASLGLAAGLIDHALLSLIGVMGLATIGVSATLIGAAGRVRDAAAAAGLLQPLTSSDPAGPLPPDAEPGGHAIVVGMNTLGRRLARELVDRGHDVLALDVDPAKLRGLPCRTMAADAEQPAVLAQAGLARAGLLVSTLQIEDTNRLLAYRARAAGVPACIHAFDASLVRELEELGVAHLMVSKHEGIRQLATELRRLGVID
jgi:Kef-type K+ transport system membrane component KefB